MCRRSYSAGLLSGKKGGRVWPSQIEYELVPGVGGMEDCVRCALYSLEGCGKIGGGCGNSQYWIVKEASREEKAE